MNEHIDQSEAETGGGQGSGSRFGRGVRQAVISMIKIIVVTYIVWLMILYFSQNRMLFPAEMAPAALGEIPYPNAKVLTVDIPEGEVVSWLIRPAGVDAEKKLPVVIFFHGNAEIIDYQQEIVEIYHGLGYAVLLPEYRGYGRAAGSPSQKAIVEDMTAFYDQLVARDDVDSKRIVYHGRSVGGGVAGQLAAERKPAAMILQSTFKSVSSMAWRYGAPPVVVSNPFRTDLVLASADWPVLIFHGKYDRIIPASHGRALGKLLREGQGSYVEYRCGHNDFPGDLDAQIKYFNHIKDFLKASVPG